MLKGNAEKIVVRLSQSLSGQRTAERLTTQSFHSPLEREDRVHAERCLGVVSILVDANFVDVVHPSNFRTQRHVGVRFVVHTDRLVKQFGMGAVPIYGRFFSSKWRDLRRGAVRKYYSAGGVPIKRTRIDGTNFNLSAYVYENLPKKVARITPIGISCWGQANESAVFRTNTQIGVRKNSKGRR